MRSPIILTGFLTAAAALQWGCGGSHEPRHAEAAERPPVAVKTFDVQLAAWASAYEAPGTVRAATAATISSKVMGYIRDIRVQPGSAVKQGQLLVTIDSRDLESSVAQARAAEAEAHSTIAEAENGIAAAKAQMQLAQVTFKRMEDLFDKKSISNQEYDEARARLQTAEASHQMALSRRAQLESRIAQAKQGVESASIMRSYSEIVAPFSGIVTEKIANPGQLATPGAPLLTIEASGGFRLEAPVEESMLGSIRLGQTVPVLLDASDQTLSARITEIVPAVDPASRSFIVKASLPASNHVRSGVFGRLRLPRGTRESIAVPGDAVSHRGEIQSVFVVENGVARTRMITTGEERDSKVEVLSGLQPGEKIVYPLPAGLADGSKVEARP